MLIRGIDSVYLQAQLCLAHCIRQYLGVGGRYKEVIKQLSQHLAKFTFRTEHALGSLLFKKRERELRKTREDVKYLWRQHKCFDKHGKFLSQTRKVPLPMSMGILVRMIKVMSSVAQFLGDGYFADAIDGLLYKLDGSRKQLLFGSPVVVYKENWSTEKTTLRNQIWLSQLAMIFAHYPPMQG